MEIIMGSIGQVTVFQDGGELELDWTISDIDTLPNEVDEWCIPNPFSFQGATWVLWMHPNGSKVNNSPGYVEVGLSRIFSGSPPNTVAFTFSLRTVKRERVLERQGVCVFQKSNLVHSINRFISQEDYRRRKSEFLSSSGLLILVFTLKAAEKCCHCNEIFQTKEILSHEKKCRIKCPDCLDIVFLKNWPDHKCPIPRAQAFEKKMHNYKTLMLSGDHSDVIVKVKNVEFRLHKNILAAQNSYFNAMFKSDMKETSTGIVRIEDCDPDIFRSFICFIYTGVTDELSSENACELYEVADMFQEDQLKKECLHFLLTNFSFDSFCNYFVLALRHDEKELLQKAIEFFLTKQKDITSTVQYQTFVKEYPTQAKELYKALYH